MQACVMKVVLCITQHLAIRRKVAQWIRFWPNGQKVVSLNPRASSVWLLSKALDSQLYKLDNKCKSLWISMSVKCRKCKSSNKTR